MPIHYNVHQSLEKQLRYFLSSIYFRSQLSKQITAQSASERLFKVAGILQAKFEQKREENRKLQRQKDIEAMKSNQNCML